jgi:RHS repeat-associated protein
VGHVRMLPADDTHHPLSHLLPETPAEWEHGDWPGPIDLIPDGVPLEKWLPRWVVALWGANPTRALPEPTVISDVQGLPIREEGKDGKARRWAYDSNGYFRWSTDLDGRTSRYEHGSWNHLLREIDPLGNITEYSYTRSDQIASVTDPEGTCSDYRYDHKDRLIEVRRHGRVRERYSYDSADNLVQKVDGENTRLLTLTIAPGNLLKQRILASGDIQNFEYAKDGRLAKAENRSGVTRYTYDLADRRVSDERDGKGVRHRFEGDRLAETTVFGRFTTQYAWTESGMTVVIDPGAGTQRLLMRGPGLAERACSNDVDELTYYDPSGRCLLKTAEGPSMGDGWARRFEYSGEGDLVRRDDSLRGGTSFEYDQAHRLHKVRPPTGDEQEYVYDRASNLLRAPGLTARMQTGNRLLEANGERFNYNARDHVDCRESNRGKTTYSYDSFDLLVAVAAPNLAYQSTHDALGRRTTKTVNGSTWHYYWDTDRLAAELFPDGRLRVYVYPDAFALVPMLFLDYDSIEADPTSGRRYHVYSDHLGCPELVLDDAGKTVWRARIAPYGTAHIDVGQDFHQPLRWPGHYFDIETGLHENRFRSYSPELGRYLQSDPSGAEGGLNLYAYTDNPLRAVDLDGLAKSCPSHVKNCPHRKQTGKNKEGPPLKNVSKATRKLAASNKNTRAAKRARAKVIRQFLKQYGREWDPKSKSYKPPTNRQIRDQMKGHDLNRPVKLGPPPTIRNPQTQFQGPAGHQGSYYTDKGTTPDQAGIASYTRSPDGRFVPKNAKQYNVDPKTPYLESTCAPCTDNWSVKGINVPTNGGGTQRVMGDRSKATPI